jgi:hypothetical protein
MISITGDDGLSYGDLRRTVELLNEYGTAKFGDEWWPGNAGGWLSDGKARELAALLEPS